MDKIIKPERYESVPRIIKKEVVETSKDKLFVARVGLYNLLDKLANGDEERRIEIYKTLYQNYKILYGVDLPKLKSQTKCKRVVDYAVQYGHIEKLFTLAKKYLIARVKSE